MSNQCIVFILPMVSSAHLSQNITQQFFYVIYRRSAVNVNNIIFLIRRLWHLIILNYYQRGKNLYRHFLLSIVFSSLIFSIDAYVESHSDGSPVFRVSMMQHKYFRCYRIQFPIKLQSNRNCRRFFSSLVQLPSSDLLMAGVFFRHSFHFTIAYLSIKINFTAALCIDLYSGKWWKKRNSTTFYAFESSVFIVDFDVFFRLVWGTFAWNIKWIMSFG